MTPNRLFEKALGLNKPWYIKKIDFDRENRKLDVQINFERGAVFEYIDADTGEVEECKCYDTKEKTWRHLNFFEHECYLHCRTPRIKTSKGNVILVTPPWSGVSNGFTLLFEAIALQMCMEMPVKSVARMLNTYDKKLWNMMKRYIEEARKEIDLSGVSEVGMDETSQCKNHDYVSVFVDMRARKTLFVTKGKDAETVKAFAHNLEEHGGNCENITEACCDMSPAFIKGIKENLPEAEITFDKFHIMKIINKAVDDVRKAEVKENEILKGTKYIFLKNRANLTEKQTQMLSELSIKDLNLKTIRALHIREAFQEIYSMQNEDLFEVLLKQWYYWASHSHLKPMKDAAYTIKKHWNGVLQWKKSQLNNGILEGLNSVIQAAKSKARGYRTFDCYKTIIYLLTADLDFTKLNPAIEPH
jgi:transposase